MKKENIIMIIVIILVALFVIFLPKVDNIISGRKVEVHTDDTNKKEKQPTQYICTSTSESGLANVSKKTIFNLSKKGKVETIDTTTITAYHSKDEYNTNKKAAQSLEAVGITYDISMDDKNYVLTVQSVQDITKNDNSSYPLEYQELNNYLAQNNYICSTK